MKIMTNFPINPWQFVANEDREKTTDESGNFYDPGPLESPTFESQEQSDAFVRECLRIRILIAERVTRLQAETDAIEATKRKLSLLDTRTAYQSMRADKILKSKDSMLRRKYGLALEAYDNMLIEQDGKCSICNLDQGTIGRTLVVDHDHITEAVRGLLCSNCNTGLGMFKDRITLLKKAIAYLEKHDEQTKANQS
jgi:hypothetical protein